MSNRNRPPRGRFLLGQLAANGDCLYATTVARQIKNDHPGCHLTWAIGSSCRRLLEGNPDVDEVWVVSPLAGERAEVVWRRFAREARRRQRQGEFDEIYLTQINPDHFYRFDGTIRATILQGYPHPITVPVAPVLRLSEVEVDHVRSFAATHSLARYRHVILFECAPQSTQSPVSPAFALAVAEKLVAAHPDLCVILSSSVTLPSPHPAVIDASILTFRENAELSKYCTLLVGCSSGITWISTSDWARPLPMIQLLGRDYVMSASVIHDFEHWSLPTARVIEMMDWDADRLMDCVGIVLGGEFAAARAAFGQAPPPTAKSLGRLLHLLLRRGDLVQAGRLLIRRFCARDGGGPRQALSALWEVFGRIVSNRLARWSRRTEATPVVPDPR